MKGQGLKGSGPALEVTQASPGHTPPAQPGLPTQAHFEAAEPASSPTTKSVRLWLYFLILYISDTKAIVAINIILNSILFFFLTFIELLLNPRDFAHISLFHPYNNLLGPGTVTVFNKLMLRVE